MKHGRGSFFRKTRGRHTAIWLLRAKMVAAALALTAPFDLPIGKGIVEVRVDLICYWLRGR